METNTAVADQNTERLLQAAYQPAQAPQAFVASLAMKMTETAKVLAQKQPPPQRAAHEVSGANRPKPWRRVALVLGGMAACILVILALSSFVRQKPMDEKKEQAKQDDPPAKKAVDAEAPPAVQLAKWTDDVRDGMMPRLRPAAPALPILKDGQKLATKAGERRLVALGDGTRLYVNEKTEVEVVAARQLSLNSGQIYLEVAPQENAPNFVVKTANRELTATGTHFGVQTDAAAAGLLVTQGKVAVKALTPDPSPTGRGGNGALTPNPSPEGRGELEVVAGQQIAAGEFAISSAARASHTLAWTRELMAAAETPMVPACQHAGGELIALDPQGQEIKLSLRQYHIDVHIEDGFARTTIDQTYFNTTWDRLEGTFYFPLPADASLSRLAMYVVDGNQCKLMEGGMAERKHAADVYETIRYMRRDPALLEWLDGSTFKMRVFPLEAKQEKRILLSYTQKLPSLYGNTRYRFAGGLNMPVVREWSFNARIKSGAGMTISCPTMPDAMMLPQGGDTLVRHFANLVKPAADVTIEMKDKTAALENDVPRFASLLADGQQYLMLRYRPTLPGVAARQRRDWIILFEASAQRDPLLAGTQVDILRNLLKNAEYDDTFVLMTANSKVQIFDEKPRPANPANVASAIKFLESAHLIGAFDLEAGLQAALKFARDAKNPHILHIGSGIPAMGQRDAGKLAQMLPARVPYVGVGVGKRWNRAFMKAAAERTNGLFAQINPDEVVAWRAFELLATLNTPRLLDVQVFDATGDPEPRFLNETTMIAQGEEICAITRVGTNKAALPGKVRVKGTLAGKPFVKEFPVTNVLSGAGYLPRIWAKQEIDRLLAADSAKHKDEIIALSKAMYVMTPFTSLLVLETDADYETYKVDRGRKDHWAMYQTPPKIPLVYEPDGKPPVKEEKPEVRKGSKPAVGEVLATVAHPRARRSSEVPPVIFTGPLSHPRYDDGGVYVGMEGVLYSTNRPAASEAVNLLGIGRTSQIANSKTSKAAFEVESAQRRERALPLYKRKAISNEDLGTAFLDDLRSTVGGAKAFDITTMEMSRITRQRAKGDKESAGLAELKIAEANLARLDIFARASETRTGSLMLGAGLNSDNGLVGTLVMQGRLKLQGDSIQKVENALRKERSEAVQYESLRKVRQVLNNHWFERIGDVKEELGTELGLPSHYQSKFTAQNISPNIRGAFDKHVDASLRYERPQFEYDRTLFTDLLQYAPGLHATWADVQATLDEEADVAAPKLGSIDSAARTLIDKARTTDWQALSIAAQGPIPGYTIQFNGIGKFTYERVLGSGLFERVICDGKTLHYLYPEIGLAGKRRFSRHHHDLAAAINPAFLPGADELARGCDLKALDASTIAIVPLWVSDLAKDETYTRVHLIFAKDGRLSERRIVEMPTGKTLGKQIFGTDGGIEWRGEGDKVLAKQPRTLVPAKTPSLQPEVSDLVVMSLPIRTPAHIIAQAKKRDVDPDRDLGVVSERFIAGCFTHDAVERTSGIARLFEMPKNRRLGYYVILNSVGVYHDLTNRVAVIDSNGSGKKWQPLDPEAEHPNNALAMFVVQGQRDLGNGGNEFLHKKLPGPPDGFLQKLARFRNLLLTWHTVPVQNPANLPAQKADVVAFLNETTSPLFAYAILDTMQRRCNIAPSDRMTELAAKRFGPITSPVGLGYVFRYEHARSLYQAGLAGDAGKQYRELYADTLKLGVLPAIDSGFRDALQVGQALQPDTPQSQAGKPDLRFVGFVRKNANELLDKKRYTLAFQLAAQMDQLGDEALCDEVLTAILAKASDKERTALTLVCVQMQAQRKNFAQADRLLAKLLADKDLAQMPELWRGRSALAKELGQTAASISSLEKALDLEYADLPEVVNLESIRADYRVILDHYQKIAEASASLEKSAPKAFLAKVIRTADRWRLIDPDASEPCKLAGKILQTVGERELAWDYWTTPIDLHPAESKPWIELAETLKAEGDLERADRAFALGFEAEPTNPEILWKRAQNLARLGQPEQARTLHRQIADGQWQQRFSATVEQARGLAGK